MSSNGCIVFATQICEMKNCTKCVFFEMRKKKDIYMWYVQYVYDIVHVYMYYICMCDIHVHACV